MFSPTLFVGGATTACGSLRKRFSEPVLTAIPFKDEAEALRLIANDVQ